MSIQIITFTQFNFIFIFKLFLLYNDLLFFLMICLCNVVTDAFSMRFGIGFFIFALSFVYYCDFHILLFEATIISVFEIIKLVFKIIGFWNVNRI
jgi:hypothetical protein